jgi:hypothetical protein
MLRALPSALFATVLAAVTLAGQAPVRADLVDRIARLTRASSWQQVAAIRVGFRTFHPQGMVRVGDAFVVSSVEVTTPTQRLASPVDGFDRTAGDGVGHLFRRYRVGRFDAHASISGGRF